MQTTMTNWADVLDGGAGDDVLSGGRGSDTFRFTKGLGGSDQIVGFERWDVLNLTGFGYSSVAQAQTHIAASGADVVFSDQGETITFLNTALATVLAANITFA
jgi:Ca2+-binding RTX toxin-like protein